MANRRISELVQLTAAQLAADDLLLVADISAHESKKLQVSDLETFILSASNTGSFFGTSSWTYNAVNALNAPQPSTASYANTSSWAYNAITSSAALDALSASYCHSGSYVVTASYAFFAEIQTIFSSALSDFATTASYLLYVPGMANGTASFALTSSLTDTASLSYISLLTDTSSFSYTSSYALFAANVINLVIISGSSFDISASWASSSISAEYAITADTASFLNYNGGFNGTASYAITAGTFPSVRIDYGMYQAMTQSAFGAQIDNVTINGPKSSSFEAFGSVTVPYSSSQVDLTSYIELIALNRWSGITASLDKSPLVVNLNGTDTGSITIPFSLVGEVPLSGSIMIYVTASNGAVISSDRNVKFDITSMATNILVNSAETMSLRIISSSGAPAVVTYTSSVTPGNVYSAIDSQLVTTGSDTILEINASSISASIMKYGWTLTNLYNLKASDNPTLYDIGGMPNSIETMSIQNCAIISLAPLTYTSASILNCSFNQLESLPELPPSMSYINCSSNPLTYLPTILPAGLISFLAEATLISAIPVAFPSTLVTISFYYNTNLTTWNSSLPPGLLNLNVANCDLSQASIEFICATLVANGLNNGTLNVSNNNGYTANALTYISTLNGRGWSVTT